jgi:hypothetical protein
MWLWADAYVQTVLRGDIPFASVITMPRGAHGENLNFPGSVTTAASALPAYFKYKSLFQGQFVVNAIRHTGELRAGDGYSWVSRYNCIPLGSAQ